MSALSFVSGLLLLFVPGTIGIIILVWAMYSPREKALRRFVAVGIYWLSIFTVFVGLLAIAEPSKCIKYERKIYWNATSRSQQYGDFCVQWAPHEQVVNP